MNGQKISKKLLVAILATGLLSFSGVIVETAMNITFPTLMKTFHVNTATVQWMTTIYLLVVAMVVPLSAYIKRSFKTKSAFLTANLLFMIGLVIDAVTPNFSILLLGRVIQGIGVGIALPLMFNIILEQVPKSKIGIMMGVGTLITAVAPAIGPTFGGFVASSLGWRYIFWLLLPILILSLGIGLATIEQKSAVSRSSLDMLSVLAIIITFVGLILGINHLAEHAFFSFSVLGWLMIGCLGLSLLVLRSQSIDNPIINLSVLANRAFSGHAIAFFLFQLGALAMSYLLPNYIQLVNGSTSTVAGLLVLPGAVIGACFAPFSGTILDKLGARKPILTGASLVLLAHLFFSIFGMHLSNALLASLYIVFMLGVGMSFGNIMTSGQQSVSKVEQADANAIFNTLQQFAGAMGTTVASLIVAMSQANTSMAYTKATAQGSQHAFILLFVLGICQLVILAKVVKKAD